MRRKWLVNYSYDGGSGRAIMSTDDIPLTSTLIEEFDVIISSTSRPGASVTSAFPLELYNENGATDETRVTDYIYCTTAEPSWKWHVAIRPPAQCGSPYDYMFYIKTTRFPGLRLWVLAYVSGGWIRRMDQEDQTMTDEQITPNRLPQWQQRCVTLKTWNGSEKDYAEGLALAADMLDQQAADLADLKSGYEDAFARGVSYGQQVLKDVGTLEIIDDPALTAAREELATLRAKVAELEADRLDGVIHDGYPRKDQ